MASWGLACVALGILPLAHPAPENPTTSIPAAPMALPVVTPTDALPPVEVKPVPCAPKSPPVVVGCYHGLPILEGQTVETDSISTEKRAAARVEDPANPTTLPAAARQPQAPPMPMVADAPADMLRQPAPVEPAAAPIPAAPCGDFGTAVTFARNSGEACKLAKLDKKLVFVLHVSGNFEDAGFT